jgi:low affinity Fe/Cu permease
VNHWFDKLARRVEGWIGNPWAFILALASITLWAVTGPLFGWSDTWQLICNTATTIVTYLIVFLIQATQTRDTTAIHIKLDELLRALEGARTGLAVAEELDRDSLEGLRDKMRNDARQADPPE